MNGPKIYFTIPLFGGIPITQTTVSSFAVMLLLCIAGIVLGSNLQKRPSRRQVLVEKGVTMLYGMVEDTMGKHNSFHFRFLHRNDRYFPLFHSGSFHHRYLGLNDKRDLLGLLH